MCQLALFMKGALRIDCKKLEERENRLETLCTRTQKPSGPNEDERGH